MGNFKRGRAKSGEGSKLTSIRSFGNYSKLGNPVHERYKEAMERPKMFEVLGQKLQHYSKIVDEFNSQSETYQHISADNMKKVEKCVDETMGWMNNAMNLQAKQQLDQSPAVYVQDIKAQHSALDSTCHRIVTQPKPKAESPKSDKPVNGINHNNEDLKADQDKTVPPQQNGECHPNEKDTIDMDLD